MKSLILVVLVALSLPSVADMVTGEFSFKRRAPFVGLVYVEEKNVTPLSVSLDQKDKTFSEKLVAATPDSKLTFTNSDGFDHNIFANDLVSKVQFDVGLIPGGGLSEVDVDWADGTLVRIGCKIHPRMRAYIANVRSMHQEVIEFDKTETEFTFELKDVPEDAKNIRIMLPGHEVISVALEKGESRNLQLVRRDRLVGTVQLTRS